MNDYGPTTPASPTVAPTAPGKSGSGGKVVLIVVIVLLVVVVLPMAFFAFMFSRIWNYVDDVMDGNNYINCAGNGKSFSVYFDGNGTYVGEETSGYSKRKELEELKNGINSHSDVEEYLKDYVKDFEKSHDGMKCEINVSKLGLHINTDTDDDEEEDDDDFNFNYTDDDEDDDDEAVVEGRQTVGSYSYGYVEVPDDWVEFKDIDGNSSVQYSDKSGFYIMSLNAVPSSMTAKQAAQNFSDRMRNDSEVTRLSGETVKAGKKGYTAYKVSMYYPGDGKYLETYWFEGDKSGVVHYIAIEGGSDLSDYSWIIDSYRETK